VGKILIPYLHEWVWMDMSYRELWSQLHDLGCTTEEGRPMYQEVREHDGFSLPSIRTLLAIIVGEKPSDIGQPWSVTSLFNEPIVKDLNFGVRIGVVFTVVTKFYNMQKKKSSA
jgi:hypothetical protein